MTSRFEYNLDKLRKENRFRTIPEESSGIIDLVSNDYLGLSRFEYDLKEEFFQTYGDASFSSSASRLLSRKQRYHVLLEKKLASLYEKDILLFNSGYHANTGILSALGSPETLFLVDELMHASALDGVKLAQFHRKSTVKKFPHNNTYVLEEILKEEMGKKHISEVIIVSESVFSMDGDVAPLNQLVEIKMEYPEVLIYLDEAHGFGVKGERGLGLAEELGLIRDVDIIVGTFGKAAFSEGAFVAASKVIKEFLQNFSRSFIFSTAIPPINAAWTYFIMDKILGMKDQRSHLASLSKEFAERLSKVVSSCQPIVSSSQIVPLLCGSADKAIETAARLRENGFDVLPIRYPTVTRGGERIRFSLNATLNHSDLMPIYKILQNWDAPR